MTKKLNMDSIRLIASFLIVAIHISPFDQINPNFDFFFTRIFCRIAVPIFLMITGYYLIDKSLKDINILKNYTKKILKIYYFKRIIIAISSIISITPTVITNILIIFVTPKPDSSTVFTSVGCKVSKFEFVAGTLVV